MIRLGPKELPVEPLIEEEEEYEGDKCFLCEKLLNDACRGSWECYLCEEGPVCEDCCEGVDTKVICEAWCKKCIMKKYRQFKKFLRK